MAYQTLQQVFERATGVPIQTASIKEFYGPMQFESATFWAMKSFFMDVPQKHPLIYGGLTTSCADLARFGLLWASKGQWNNHTVFTQAFWNKAMSTPAYPFGPGRRYGNWGPHDTDQAYRSVGLGKQIIYFNMQNGVVATRLGEYATSKYDYNDWFALIMASIKNPEDRGKPEDWMGVVTEDGEHFESIPSSASSP
jgi:CubicO group peptidase (beta-lactamase class C family)